MVPLTQEYPAMPPIDSPRPEQDDDLARQTVESFCAVSWVGLLVIMLGAVWLRWHLLDVPLERDEGEYAYGGQLLLQGVPPYQLLFNMKLPGIYAVYALILAIFGQTQAGVHLGLLCANVATLGALFWLACRFAGPLAGLCAAAVFAVLSVGQAVQGIFANAEHFVLVPALWGAVLLVAGLDSKRSWSIFFSGVLLGLGFLIKQHGALFAFWAGFVVVAQGLVGRITVREAIRFGICLVAGTTLPYGLTCLLLLGAGVFSQFWFWTVDYARAYATQVSLSVAWGNLTDRISALLFAAPLPWAAAGVGVIFCLVGFRGVRRPWLAMSFFLFSFLAVCPGFFFRPHYFVLLLPAAALLSGIAIAAGARLAVRSGRAGMTMVVALTLLVLLLGETLYRQRHFLFFMTPAQASAASYWPNPFNESLELARYIEANSKPFDTIAIIGSEPQVFFYARRRSATGYIYMYPLMEGHKFALEMQKRLIAEVEMAKPEYLLFVRIETSWLPRPDSHTLIYEWFTGYREGYDRVAVVEIFSSTSRYSWLKQSIWPPQSPYWIEVLRKKNGETGEVR